MRTKLITVLLAAAAVAHADPLREDEYMVFKPDRGIERAVNHGRPSWCPKVFAGEPWSPERTRRAIASGNDDTRVDGAIHLCQWADDPTWQQQATYVIQSYMNDRKASQAEAERYIGILISRAPSEPTDQDRLGFGQHDLTPISASRGVDTARVTGAPAWCDKASIDQPWLPSRIARSVKEQWGINVTVDAALHICQRPNDASWRIEAGYILQKWMNFTGQSQASAEASLRARVQTAKFKAARDATCKGLEYSAELGGEAKAYAEAHVRFFGCTANESTPLWQDPGVDTKDEVGFYFDADDKVESEIIRLYWLFHATSTPSEKLPSKDVFDNKPLLDYAVASVDYAKIDRKALAKYASNDFTRVVIDESIAVLEWRRKMYEQAIDKLAKGDAEYTAILRDAPKRGFAEWQRLTDPWRAEIARSNELEKKLSSPSRKALAGCEKELFADAQKLIKSYKLTDYNALVTKVSSDPVASLLLSRLAVCYGAEKVVGVSGALRDLVKQGRELRGPRSLAYYTIVDTLSATLKDRPRLLVNLDNFYLHTKSLVDLYDRELDFRGALHKDPEKDRQSGVVKAINKVADGIEIIYKPTKVTYPEYDCVATGRPLKINSDGRIEYYQNCKATGKMLSQNTTPAPIVIAPAVAQGVKPGAYIVATGSSQTAKNGDEIGVVVYVKSKSGDAKLQTFFGFAL